MERQRISCPETVADHLSREGLTAELADADAGAVPPPADYETVVIGSAPSLQRVAFQTR